MSMQTERTNSHNSFTEVMTYLLSMSGPKCLAQTGQEV